MVREGEITLNADQRLCLGYYEEINSPLQRKEVEEVVAFIREVVLVFPILPPPLPLPFSLFFFLVCATPFASLRCCENRRSAMFA